MGTGLTFKNDAFKKHRGGYSRWLSLSCAKCKTRLIAYQKDGPGILKRLYLDRIVSPVALKRGKSLECSKCKTILGVSVLYQKENRPAYRLFAGAIERKIIKSNDIALKAQ